MTYERIVVAVAASGEDEHLLARVTRAINGNGTSHIDLVHVAGHPVTAYGDDGSHHVAPLRQLREQRFASVKSVAERFGIPPGRVHIEFGDTIELLARFTAHHGCDLLVVGNHTGGLAGIRRRVAADLLKECRCDVLVMQL